MWHFCEGDAIAGVPGPNLPCVVFLSFVKQLRQVRMAEWHPLPAPAAGAENGQASREADRTEEIYRQLDRICASRAFRGSLRLTRFLRFTVETALVGKSDTIKAYTIAVEALGRDANFDPQSDPIVRVEAGRLRQALARY